MNWQWWRMSSQDPGQIVATVPRAIEIGAKRLARQAAMSLDDYITTLVEAALAAEASRPHRRITDEEPQPAAEWVDIEGLGDDCI